jgi:hypothetical protein
VILLALSTYACLWGAGTSQPPGYRRIAEAIAAHSPPETVIWHNDHRNIATFLNLYRGRASILGLLETKETLSPESADRLSSLAASSQPVWIISRERVGTADVLDRTASQRKGVVQEISLSAPAPGPSRPPAEADVLKALFYFDTPDWQLQPVDVKLGENGEALIRLAEARVSSEAKAGEVLAVQLAWEALAPVSEAYQVYLQLIGPDGAPLALHIGPAQNGLTPTSAWPPGGLVTDVHAFRLRADAPPGEYRFRVGLQRVRDATRLQTTDGRDAVSIGPVLISPTEVQ